MLGFKRPDLSELNKLIKRKPKEFRHFTCALCSDTVIREEFCHHLPKIRYYCDAKCRNNYSRNRRVVDGILTPRASRKGIPCPRKPGFSAWNKGQHNPLAAANGKKGAIKQAQTVTGRRKQIREDGT